jgi:hypothetical protein
MPTGKEYAMLIERFAPLEHVRFSANAELFPAWAQNGLDLHSWCDGWDPLPASFTTANRQYVPGEDKFGSDGIMRGEVLSPIYNPFDLVSLLPKSGDKSTIKFWEGLQPHQDDDRGISVGVRTASANFHNIKQLFTGLDRPDGFVTNALLRTAGERSVAHTNLKGTVTCHVEGDLYRRPLIEGSYMDESNYHAPTRQITFVRLGDGTLSFALGGALATFPEGWARQAQEPHYYLHNTDYHDWYYGSDDYGDPSYGNSGNTHGEPLIYYRDPECMSVAKIAYISESYFRDGDWHNYSIHRVEVFFEWVVNQLIGVLDTLVETGDFLKMRTTYRSTRIYREAQHVPTQGPLYTYTDNPVYEFVHESPSYVTHAAPNYLPESGVGRMLKDSISLDGSEITTTRTSYNALRQFDRRVHAESKRLFPAVFHSARDATKDYMAELEANHLENLSQLGSIRTMIEPVKGFTTLASAIVRKDVRGTVLGLFDLLTDFQLVYAYGIAPSISDAQEISERADELNRTYITREQLFTERTMNGKFTWDIPDDVIPPYDGCKLITRSKVRMKFNQNSILASLMPIKAFGLLPTLSNMWDLIPFSFVADWFTGIGDKLGAADDALTMLAYDVRYSVNSMKVHWPICNELLDRNAVVPSDDPEFTFYVRSVMAGVPTLTYTDLDFIGGEVSFPDWKTVASLVYKFVRN